MASFTIAQATDQTEEGSLRVDGVLRKPQESGFHFTCTGSEQNTASELLGARSSEKPGGDGAQGDASGTLLVFF